MYSQWKIECYAEVRNLENSQAILWLAVFSWKRGCWQVLLVVLASSCLLFVKLARRKIKLWQGLYFTV